MAGDIEKAKREMRWAKSAAEERRWDQLEPRIETIEAALQGVPETEAAPVLAELKPLREKLTNGVREEKAGQIEREIRRNLSGAADQLSSGYRESVWLQKAIDRLASAEAREVLSPDTISKLQAEIVPLQAKSGGGSPPPPPAKPAPAPTPQPTPAAAPARAGSAPASAPSEQAQRIENDIARTLKYAVEDIASNPSQGAPHIERLNSRLDSNDARENLSPETIQRFRAQVAELQAKVDAFQRQDKVRRLEDYIGKFLRNAQNDLEDDPRSAGDMLRRARERLEQYDVTLLPPESLARIRSEIERLDGLISRAGKKEAAERALENLKQLEQRVARPIFDGSDAAYNIVRDLDGLKSRVRDPLSKLPEGDPDAKAIETRLAAVDAKIAAATAKLGRDEAHARVVQAWESEQKAIAGWEGESSGSANSPTYEMPKTASAVRRLTWFLNDADFQKIGSDYKDDREIHSLLAQARKTLDSAVAKLHGAFNALLAFMEKQPRPSSRFDLEKPRHLTGQAGTDFEGTPHKEANTARAKALGDRWEAEIEANRGARQAKYNELSVQASAAWPKILTKLKAEDEFNPSDPKSKGRTVLVKELRNRIGWDFTGEYDFAIWVNETPVVGNYDKAVSAAVEEACENTGLPLDDHTDWDAVIVVGGAGKIKQRFNIEVRDRNNLEIGKIEEWRPVDCVQCTVIALRAGPVAAGPKA
jgi:hypothetical protein